MDKEKRRKREESCLSLAFKRKNEYVSFENPVYLSLQQQAGKMYRTFSISQGRAPDPGPVMKKEMNDFGY